MVSHLLPQSIETLCIVEHILLLPHVFPRLDASFVGYWNVYCLFNLILAGRVIVAGSFDEKDGRLLGICWGEFSGQRIHCPCRIRARSERHRGNQGLHYRAA